jgi:hypothetical protein
MESDVLAGQVDYRQHLIGKRFLPDPRATVSIL